MCVEGISAARWVVCVEGRTSTGGGADQARIDGTSTERWGEKGTGTAARQWGMHEGDGIRNAT
jgi:hypothetical protein